MQLSLIKQGVSLEFVGKYFLRVDPSTKITVTEPPLVNPRENHLRFIPRVTSAPPLLTATCSNINVTRSDSAPLGKFEQLCGKKLLVLYGNHAGVPRRFWAKVRPRCGWSRVEMVQLDATSSKGFKKLLARIDRKADHKRRMPIHDVSQAIQEVIAGVQRHRRTGWLKPLRQPGCAVKMQWTDDDGAKREGSAFCSCWRQERTPLHFKCHSLNRTPWVTIPSLHHHEGVIIIAIVWSSRQESDGEDWRWSVGFFLWPLRGMNKLSWQSVQGCCPEFWDAVCRDGWRRSDFWRLSTMYRQTGEDTKETVISTVIHQFLDKFASGLKHWHGVWRLLFLDLATMHVVSKRLQDGCSVPWVTGEVNRVLSEDRRGNRRQVIAIAGQEQVCVDRYQRDKELHRMVLFFHFWIGPCGDIMSVKWLARSLLLHCCCTEVDVGEFVNMLGQVERCFCCWICDMWQWRLHLVWSLPETWVDSSCCHGAFGQTMQEAWQFDESENKRWTGWGLG